MFELKELCFFSRGFCHSVELHSFFTFGSHKGFCKMDVMQIQKGKKKRQYSQCSYYSLVCIQLFSYLAMWENFALPLVFCWCGYKKKKNLWPLQTFARGSGRLRGWERLIWPSQIFCVVSRFPGPDKQEKVAKHKRQSVKLHQRLPVRNIQKAATAHQRAAACRALEGITRSSQVTPFGKSSLSRSNRPNFWPDSRNQGRWRSLWKPDWQLI